MSLRSERSLGRGKARYAYIREPGSHEEPQIIEYLAQGSRGGALHRHRKDQRCREAWGSCEFIEPAPVPDGSFDVGTNGCPKFRTRDHDDGTIQHICVCGWVGPRAKEWTSIVQAGKHAADAYSGLMGVPQVRGAAKQAIDEMEPAIRAEYDRGRP